MSEKLNQGTGPNVGDTTSDLTPVVAPRRSRSQPPTIGMVVPALPLGGGVPAVADFLCRQIELSGRFRLKLFSLATSRNDPQSLRLLSPATWRANPSSTVGFWQGREYRQFGSFGAELEFLRLSGTRALRESVRECDLIQVVSGSPAPALTISGCGRPVVLQVATRAIIERRKTLANGQLLARTWRRTMARIVDAYDDRALRGVAAVMVENDWMHRYVRSVVDPKLTSVEMAPPGIDCERFAPLPDPHARLADPYLLFVGRFADPRKNVLLLCRAYAHICAQSEHPPRLVLAGHGELPEDARAVLSDPRINGRVRLVVAPSNDELLNLYRHALCLALPSDEEGFGMVVIEAMACGVPVVATRCGGPEEIITPSQDGFLVPLDDTREFAAHLKLLAEQERNLVMGQRARDKVLSRFSSAAAFRPFLSAYDRLLP